MAPNVARDFGRYELVSKLASGGMAVTYRAVMKGAAGVTKPVVIKQILPHFADDPAFVEMFISEARVVTALTHSNIAQVFDFGEIDGQYFLAMEFVHGQPLSKLLRRAQRAGLPSLPIPLALYIASQICDGLDYAHRHQDERGEPVGLVHRDVSPDNVLISYEGQVKVIDFGIAKATSLVEARTSPGMLKGKYPYFSTEQAQGHQDLDSRSDTFAVGVVLYEMLCGRRPYDGEITVVLPRLLAGDYPAPASLNPSISPEVQQVLATAMALDRDERYPTAQAFSEALREQLYSAWPRFSPSMASQLLGHLFSEELANDGRRVEVTPAFLEQFEEWRQQLTSVPPRPASAASPLVSSRSRPRPDTGEISGAMPTSSSGRRSASRPSGAHGAVRGSQSGVSSARRPTSSTNMRAPVTSARDAEEPATLPAPGDVTPLESPLPTAAHATQVEGADGGAPADGLSPEARERAAKHRRLVMQLSVPLFSIALLAGLLYLVFSPRRVEDSRPKGTLWLTSVPAGATVQLNGQPVSGVTPLIVPNLPLDQANTLVLTLSGYRPWTKRFTPVSSNGVQPEPPLNAELEPIEAPAPAPPPVAVVDTPAPEARPDKAEFQEMDYPTRLFVLRPRYNAFPVEKYDTASIELSPGVAYSVSTEGSVSLASGPGGGVNTVAYYAEGDNLSADTSFGLIGPSARTLKGVRRLHVFLLDDDLSDNSGSLRVRLRQSQLIAPRSLTLDATRNVLVLPREQQFVLRGLDPNALYLLTVRDDVAELSPGVSGHVHRVLCVESRQQSSRRPHRLLEAGKRVQLTGADTLRCTFPDTRVEDNVGAFEVDLVDVTKMTRQERAALRDPPR